MAVDTFPAPVLPAIRTRLGDLGEADARVARYLLEDPSRIVYQTVTETAQGAGTSASTVVRCAQALGFKGFHGLKLAVAQDLAATARPPGEPGAGGTMAAVLDATARSVRDIAATVPRERFEQVAALLDEAGRVLVVGAGTSYVLGEFAAYRLTAVGIDARLAPPSVQSSASRLLAPGDVCLALSHTGSTRETVEGVVVAQQAGATGVAITSFSRSPLTEVADIALVAGSPGISPRVDAITSRIPHMALLDALVVALCARDEDRTGAALDAYARGLEAHRY